MKAVGDHLEQEELMMMTEIKPGEVAEARENIVISEIYSPPHG